MWVTTKTQVSKFRPKTAGGSMRFFVIIFFAIFRDLGVFFLFSGQGYEDAPSLPQFGVFRYSEIEDAPQMLSNISVYAVFVA